MNVYFIVRYSSYIVLVSINQIFMFKQKICHVHFNSSRMIKNGQIRWNFKKIIIVHPFRHYRFRRRCQSGQVSVWTESRCPSWARWGRAPFCCRLFPSPWLWTRSRGQLLRRLTFAVFAESSTWRHLPWFWRLFSATPFGLCQNTTEKDKDFFVCEYSWSSSPFTFFLHCPSHWTVNLRLKWYLNIYDVLIY